MVTGEAPASAAAPVRSWRERVLQTLAFELGGLLIVAPVWTLVTGASATESVTLLLCLSVAVMSWMAAYNTAFDLIESRLTGMVASDRPIPATGAPGFAMIDLRASEVWRLPESLPKAASSHARRLTISCGFLGHRDKRSAVIAGFSSKG